ncbi:hypothetical protein [Kitasatospora indigofera]|uniref:hypothetical protein n=2 Tax=Kitasatospora TaxID=2063 RepID=UPI00369C792A
MTFWPVDVAMPNSACSSGGMTTKRPGATSPNLPTLVVVAFGEQIARVVWETHGDRIRAAAVPAARSLATGTRAAVGEASRRLVDDGRVMLADAVGELGAEAKTLVGEAARNYAEGLFDVLGQVIRDTATGRTGAS